MLKKILLSISALLLVGAIGTAAYQATTGTAQAASGTTRGYVAGNQQGYGTATQAQTDMQASSAVSVQGNRGGQSNGGNRWQGANGNGSAGEQAVPHPQNGLTTLETYHGVVENFAAPNFTLVTDDGQSLPAEVGNINYLASIGLTLQDGDGVTVTGFWGQNGGFSVVQLTLDTTAQTFALRDDYGRPMWRGGHH